MSEVKQESPAFETWAIVEIMGHKVVAGKCTEETRFGAVMLRVDTPAFMKGSKEWVGNDMKVVVRGYPAHTRYFGGSSIFSFSPCSEEVALEALRRITVDPYIPVEKKVQMLGEATSVEAQQSAELDEDDFLPH